MPRDLREWISVAATMPDHPKVEGLSDAAFRLLIESWCWSKRQRTDGLIPERAWARRRTPRVRAELVEAGLIETTPGGVRIHDYAEHQWTEAQAAERSATRAAAGAAGGRAKAAKRLASASTLADTSQASALANSGNGIAEEKRREEKRQQTPPNPPAGGASGDAKRGTRLPDGWDPPADVVADMRAEFPDLTADQWRALHAEFRDYWRGVPGAKGCKVDWDATWRNSIRRNAPRYRVPQQRRLPDLDLDAARARARSRMEAQA